MTNREENAIGCVLIMCEAIKDYKRKDVVLDEKILFYLNNIPAKLKKISKYIPRIINPVKLIDSATAKVSRKGNEYEAETKATDDYIVVTDAEIILWNIAEPAVRVLDEFIEKSKNADIGIKAMCRSVSLDWGLLSQYIEEGAR